MPRSSVAARAAVRSAAAFAAPVRDDPATGANRGSASTYSMAACARGPKCSCSRSPTSRSSPSRDRTV
ncbi:hypothetical protein [Pseudosporangium ferrugineum]|uniref:hypothetical protein n=1 Tax=Pseudosporangium ferrugineum TaxID=439699 RepID=UPI001474D895|nr:hypothetical protein [Pseudosporangium ferrugineum]